MVLKGVSIVAFGLVALCYPGEEIYTMMPAFGILATFNGLAIIFNGLWFSKSGSRWKRSLIRNGMIEMLIGATAILCLVLSIPVFMELIAIWAIFTGSIYINRFRKLKNKQFVRGIMVATGIISVVFGAFVLINLQAGLVPFTYEVAIFSLLTGSCTTYAFVRLGKMQEYLRNTPKKIHSRKTTVYYDRAY